jgi:hypothetical protein
MIKRKERRDYQTTVVYSKYETSSTVPLTNEQIAEKFIIIKLKAAVDLLGKYSIKVDQRRSPSVTIVTFVTTLSDDIML